MNYYEWKEVCKNKTADHHWDGACRRIQKSLKYNPDPKAIHRHHLRDTEEQRQYNDTHYELWGFEIDENGNEHFEYGKYIIFVTPEEHTLIHTASDETRKKLSENNTRYWLGKKRYDSTVKKLHEYWTDEKREVARINNLGENNPMYGKVVSDETRKKMSESISAAMSTPEAKERAREAQRSRWLDDDYRKNVSEKLRKYYSIQENRDKMSEAVKSGYTDEVRKMFREMYTGERNPFYGKHHSETTKQAISMANKGKKGPVHSDEAKARIGAAQKVITNSRAEKYKEYKSNGDTMTWNEFQKYASTLNKEE